MNMPPMFSMVVDDGAFAWTFPCGRGKPIPFSAYENLVRLAMDFNIQITLACTTSFLDIYRVTPHGRPHDDSRRIIALLERHNRHILVADHGYLHQWGKRYVEFHDYRTGATRPCDEQKRHIDWSVQIYRSLGWKFPGLFVAPGHGWEPGVTDRLYAERGCRFLSAFLWIKRSISQTSLPRPTGIMETFRPHTIYPDASAWLTVLPRLGLLIPADCDSPGWSMWLRARHAVLSPSTVMAYLLHRHPVSQPHNYMAHIMNFSTDEALRGWVALLENISHKIPLASTFEQSITQWRKRLHPATTHDPQTVAPVEKR